MGRDIIRFGMEASKGVFPAAWRGCAIGMNGLPVRRETAVTVIVDRVLIRPANLLGIVRSDDAPGRRLRQSFETPDQAAEALGPRRGLGSGHAGAR